MVNKFIFFVCTGLAFLSLETTAVAGTGLPGKSAGKDSIGIKIINGEKFIQHKIGKGETLYSLNRRYGAPVDAIRKANPVKAEKLVVGDVLLIPTAAPSKADASNNTPEAGAAEKKNEKAVRETPIPREVSGEALKQEKPAPPAEPANKPDYIPQSATFTPKTSSTGEPVWQVKVNGKIEIFTDPRVQADPMYAIHKDIPEGTLIKIINPANEKFVVVRSIRPAENQVIKKEVFLYISPIAARYLDIQADPDRMEMRFTVSTR